MADSWLPDWWYFGFLLALTVVYVVKEAVKARRARNVSDMENVIPIRREQADAWSHSEAR
jgi:hypothetical protein